MGAVLSQNAAKYAIIDFGSAAESWGEYRQKVKIGQRAGHGVGFPRFKRRKHEQGFRADNGPDTVKVDGEIVILPKIGRVAMVEELRFNGSIRDETVNRTAGTWFARFCVEDGQEPPAVKAGSTIGVDVGAMATCSDGKAIQNPKALSSALKQLRRIDKAIARSRNVHGKSNHSNRRRAAVRQAAQVARSGSERTERPSSQGDDSDSQVGGPSGGGDAERGGHDAGPPGGQSYCRCWDVQFSLHAGGQNRLVRRRVRESGPMVCIIQAVLAPRLAEWRPNPL